MTLPVEDSYNQLVNYCRGKSRTKNEIERVWETRLPRGGSLVLNKITLGSQLQSFAPGLL